jgi:hypothetical protein
MKEFVSVNRRCFHTVLCVSWLSSQPLLPVLCTCVVVSLSHTHARDYSRLQCCVWSVLPLIPQDIIPALSHVRPEDLKSAIFRCTYFMLITEKLLKWQNPGIMPFYILHSCDSLVVIEVNIKITIFCCSLIDRYQCFTETPAFTIRVGNWASGVSWFPQNCGTYIFPRRHLNNNFYTRIQSSCITFCHLPLMGTIKRSIIHWQNCCNICQYMVCSSR